MSEKQNGKVRLTGQLKTVYGTSSSHGIFAGCLKHLDLPPGQARGIFDAVLCADLHLYGGLSLHLQ